MASLMVFIYGAHFSLIFNVYRFWQPFSAFFFSGEATKTIVFLPINRYFIFKC